MVRIGFRELSAITLTGSEFVELQTARSNCFKLYYSELKQKIQYAAYIGNDYSIRFFAQIVRRLSQMCMHTKLLFVNVKIRFVYFE